YLQPNLHERILALFHYALKPDGILVLGNSESVGAASAMFAPLDKSLRIYAPAGVVVDDQLQVVHFRGRTGAYLEPAAGTASFDLLDMARHDLRSELRAAIRKARKEADVVRAEGILVHDDGALRYVDLEVIPFKVVSSEAQFFVVLFEDIDRAIATRRRARERRVR